jgi:hypothetical protein
LEAGVLHISRIQYDMTQRATGQWLIAIALTFSTCLAGSYVAAQPAAMTASPSKSSWPTLTLSAEPGPRRFTADQKGTFNATMPRYATGVLKVKGLPPYLTLVPDPYGFEESWGYIAPPRPALDVVQEEQIRANPTLRVMIPRGVFDTTSLMGGTEALFAQMRIPREQFAIVYYAGGQMLYSDEDGMQAFNADVRAFVGGANLKDRPFPVAQPANQH